MAKKKFNFTDLSPKELELLKEKYIDLRVKSMNMNDLKDFVTENISLQIKNTIGKDEELEAWKEMEDFFKDEFDNTIQNIQIKLGTKNVEHASLDIKKVKRDDAGKEEEKKLDMWED